MARVKHFLLSACFVLSVFFGGVFGVVLLNHIQASIRAASVVPELNKQASFQFFYEAQVSNPSFYLIASGFILSLLVVSLLAALLKLSFNKLSKK